MESGAVIGRGGKTGSENSGDWLCVRVGGACDGSVEVCYAPVVQRLSKLERS